MQKLQSMIRRTIIYLNALVLVAGYPLTAMADTQEPATDLQAPMSEQTPEPKKEPAYTYNPETGTWDSKQWKYNAATGAYERPPKPVIVEPEVVQPPAASNDITVDTGVTVNTTVDADATSGDSAVIYNTKGGDATSGSASSVATILNSVNSSIGTGKNQEVATFTQDIMGDVKGDIILYPTLLKAMLEANVSGGAQDTIKAQTNNNLTNNVNIAATSGDAAVKNNTQGGNATTGPANAVANVVNILNSMIATQDSFIGTINIYGNLEGDILIAPDFIPQILANNSDDEASKAMKVSSGDTTTIVNNITAVAESGAANVFGNTQAGNATTGDAASNVVIFNVSGHDIIAKNSLLVFVNVLGTWVGMIVDAPANATAAMIGNDVTKNEKYTPDITVDTKSNHGITNTIAVKATTGDATVKGNTTGGDATTGDATAVANVANVSNSQFGFSDWFGVLFINVYQSWHGSFGIDTEYGNGVQEEAIEPPTAPIKFVPREPVQTNERSIIRIVDSRSVLRQDSESAPVIVSSAVLASVAKPNTTVKNDINQTARTLEAPADYRIWIVAGSLLIFGISALGIRRLLT